MAKPPDPQKYHQRLILPLGSREIEFALPPNVLPVTPPRSRRPTPTTSPPTTASISPSTARHHLMVGRARTTTAERRPDQSGGASATQRRFSSAFLFPTAHRSSSPLLATPSIFHSSAPSSPLPACTPSPSMSPSLSPLPSLFGFFRDAATPSPGASSRTSTRTPSPSPRVEVTTPVSPSPRVQVTTPVSPAVQLANGVLQSSLGALNPDLYKSPLIPEEDTSNYPDGHLGRVWFSLNYDRQQEKLHINLVRIHNLPSRDAADPAASCDPLVRIALLPGERRYQQSSIQRKTCNPVYNENFGFCVSHKELSEQTVKLSVVDNGRPRKRQTIGHLLCSLKELSVENGKQQLITQDLSRDPASAGSLGEMHVSLCYHPSADRFTVTVLQARHIKAINTATPDSYVRLTLFHQTRAVKTKRTCIVRRSAEPCYNESFHFRLEAAAIDATNIVLAIHQPDNKDRILGRLVLGSFMFARGRGQAHWSEMLARPREHIQRWHQLPEVN